MNYRKFLISSFILVAIWGCNPDLILKQSKIYHEPGDTSKIIANDAIFLQGFGINNNVITLPPDPVFEVSRFAVNAGNKNAPAGYIISDSIIRMVFVGIHGSYGFIPGPSPSHVTVLPNETGPAISPDDSTLITLGPTGPLDCGLYKQVMVIDSTNVVLESNESNNKAVNYFFVPGQHFCNINKVTIVDNLVHSNPPIITHVFTITPFPGDTCIFTGFSYTTSEGSSATTIPKPPVLISGAPLQVSMEVTPLKHDWPPGGQLAGKITVIGIDGCSIRQESAKVWLEHPPN